MEKLISVRVEEMTVVHVGGQPFYLKDPGYLLGTEASFVEAGLIKVYPKDQVPEPREGEKFASRKASRERELAAGKPPEQGSD
jgi:hypothetical protein